MLIFRLLLFVFFYFTLNSSGNDLRKSLKTQFGDGGERPKGTIQRQ